MVGQARHAEFKIDPFFDFTVRPFSQDFENSDITLY